MNCEGSLWNASSKFMGLWEMSVPWADHTGTRRILIWIEPRPAYCDRGRYIAQTDAPLDHQEGWPRYYFDLDTAKREVEAWIESRKEIKP